MHVEFHTSHLFSHRRFRTIPICKSICKTVNLFIEFVGKKSSFLQSLFNKPKCIVVGLLMGEGLFSLLFYCESVIN